MTATCDDRWVVHVARWVLIVRTAWYKVAQNRTGKPTEPQWTLKKYCTVAYFGTAYESTGVVRWWRIWLRMTRGSVPRSQNQNAHRRASEPSYGNVSTVLNHLFGLQIILCSLGLFFSFCSCKYSMRFIFTMVLPLYRVSKARLCCIQKSALFSGPRCTYFDCPLHRVRPPIAR